MIQSEMDQPTFDKYVDLVAQMTNVPGHLIFAGGRTPKHLHARRILATVLRLDGHNYSSIARMMLAGDHSTVQHQVQTASDGEKETAKRVLSMVAQAQPLPNICPYADEDMVEVGHMLWADPNFGRTASERIAKLAYETWSSK